MEYLKIVNCRECGQKVETKAQEKSTGSFMDIRNKKINKKEI